MEGPRLRRPLTFAFVVATVHFLPTGLVPFDDADRALFGLTLGRIIFEGEDRISIPSPATPRKGLDGLLLVVCRHFRSYRGLLLSGAFIGKVTPPTPWPPLSFPLSFPRGEGRNKCKKATVRALRYNRNMRPNIELPRAVLHCNMNHGRHSRLPCLSDRALFPHSALPPFSFRLSVCLLSRTLA